MSTIYDDDDHNNNNNNIKNNNINNNNNNNKLGEENGISKPRKQHTTLGHYNMLKGLQFNI